LKTSSKYGHEEIWSQLCRNFVLYRHKNVNMSPSDHILDKRKCSKAKADLISTAIAIPIIGI